MAKRQRFSVTTPLGHRVVLTRDRWRVIVRYKHPALTGHDEDVQDCLRDPDRIRASAKDPNTHLDYRTMERCILCVLVAGEELRQRFVVTAYFTQSLKQGQDLWTK